MRSNIYIRKHNERAWNELQDKSQFVNDKLEEMDAGGAVSGETKEALGIELGCCLNKKPCKHWQYDENEQVYINTLSGRKKEIES